MQNSFQKPGSPKTTVRQDHPNVGSHSNRKRRSEFPDNSQVTTPFYPDNYGDMISEGKPKPICDKCSLVHMTWAAFEYHIFRFHIFYRPYQCGGCRHLAFHTEEEGRHHLIYFHGGGPDNFPLIKTTDFAKENEWLDYLVNAKTTELPENLLPTSEQLQCGLEMLTRIQKIKFRTKKAQLPHSIRSDNKMVDASTDPKIIIPDEIREQPEENPTIFEEPNIEFNFMNTDVDLSQYDKR